MVNRKGKNVKNGSDIKAIFGAKISTGLKRNVVEP